MKKWVNFCKQVLNRGIKFDKILFTNKAKVSLGSFTNYSIILSRDSRGQLKNGEKKFQK